MRPFSTTRVAPIVLAVALIVPAGAPARGAASSTSAANTGSATEPGPTKQMLARVERRIADLHAKLHITAGEEQQWQHFASVMRENATKIDQMAEQRAKTFNSLNAVQNMQSYADAAEQHAQNMKRLTAAFERLYESMSDAQKHTADVVFRDYVQHRHRK